MAELRGRLRPGGPRPVGTVLDRADHSLPLATERSPTEQMIQTRCVLADLATAFGAASSASTPPKTSADDLEDASKVLDGARRGHGTTTPDEAWKRVAEIIYAWDADFQDALAAQSIDHGRAYELGRALAETYWALDPDAPASKDAGAPPPNTWEFLFGTERIQIIDERARSLAPHFHPVTVPVVSATVHAWAAVVVVRGEIRKPKTASRATDALRQQISYWHELVVAGVDPETLLKPYASLHFTKITPRVLRSFATEATIGAVGLAGLIGLAFLSVEVQGIPGWKTLAGVAGVLGITIGGVQAALKNSAQSMLRRLRADVYTDLVAAETTSLPPLRWRVRRAVRKEVRARRVTAPLPAR